MRITKYKTKLALNKSVELEKVKSVNWKGYDGLIKNSYAAYEFARKFLHLHEDSDEYAYMICLNNKLKITSVFEVSHGFSDWAIIQPREVFQKALLANAHNIVLLHNHPSGDTTPSDSDINVTKKLREAGNLIGVKLVDHVIISPIGYHSVMYNDGI